MYINKSTGNTSAKVPVEKTTAPSWTSETTEPNPIDSDIISNSSSKSKPQCSVKGQDLLSKDYKPREATTPAADSYIEETDVVSPEKDLDTRYAEAESKVLATPKEPKTFKQKVAELPGKIKTSASYAMRKGVNSGYAVREIADDVKKSLYKKTMWEIFLPHCLLTN